MTPEDAQLLADRRLDMTERHQIDAAFRERSRQLSRSRTRADIVSFQRDFAGCGWFCEHPENNPVQEDYPEMAYLHDLRDSQH